MCAICVFIHPIGVAIGLTSSHCLQIQSEVLATATTNSEPTNRNFSDSVEVQSEISDERTLCIAVCLEWDLEMKLNCVTNLLYIECSNPGILYFFLLVNTWCNLSFFFFSHAAQQAI